MNFAFAGTPDFAAWVLRDLVGMKRHPSLVISQPDRPRGRGRRPASPPAAIEAHRLGLDCVQTDDINSAELLDRLGSSGISALVVASFGQILAQPLLESLWCLNIHGSLLPLYRGAAPIERALAAGEGRIGVSIMRITEDLDQGPLALQTSLSLNLWDDAGSVGRALALLGALGIAQVLGALADGTVKWCEQQGQSSYAEKLTPQDGVLDTARGAKAVHDQVRSLSPSVGARARSADLEFKVWRTWPYGEPGLDTVPDRGADAAGLPGRLSLGDGRMFVGCAEGTVEVLMVQPAGRRKMNAGAFLRGYGDQLSARLEQVTDEQSACDVR